MSSDTRTMQSTQRSLRPLYITRSLLQHWLLIFIVVYGIFNALPFLAPVLMKMGWSGGANMIYTFYSGLCHQMAQRSFFLFGDHFMYEMDQLPVNLTGNTGTDTLLLREFRGNETLGWKVAWSDRMISMYAGIWLVSLVYWAASRFRPPKPVSIWLAGLLVIPIALDGGTHMISDMAGGLVEGFRYHNDWLAILTVHAFPESFYRGDALGTFNSWLRLFTGLLLAVGAVWLAFPYMDRHAQSTVIDIDAKIERVSISRQKTMHSYKE